MFMTPTKEEDEVGGWRIIALVIVPDHGVGYYI